MGLVSVPKTLLCSLNFDVKKWLLGLELCRTFLKGAPGSGRKYGPQWWEASVLTTAHAPSPLLAFVYLIVSLWTLFFCSFAFPFLAKGVQTLIFFLERPELIPISPRMIRVIKGMDLIMDVQVKGYPYPRSTWSHNGLLLPNTSNFGSKTKLIIRKVTVLEGGLYSCYAKNPDGQANLTFNVSVEGIDFICSKAIFVRVDIAFQ